MHRRGLTLLETLVAGTLLLLTILALFRLMSSAYLAFAVGEQKLTAGGLAQSLLEEQRAAEFDEVATADLGPVTVGSIEYSRRLDVSTRSPVLKEVRVQVSWGKRTLVRRSTLCKLPR